VFSPSFILYFNNEPIKDKASLLNYEQMYFELSAIKKSKGSTNFRPQILCCLQSCGTVWSMSDTSVIKRILLWSNLVPQGKTGLHRISIHYYLICNVSVHRYSVSLYTKSIHRYSISIRISNNGGVNFKCFQNKKYTQKALYKKSWRWIEMSMCIWIKHWGCLLLEQAGRIK
jgi:hypothetical protein